MKYINETFDVLSRLIKLNPDLLYLSRNVATKILYNVLQSSNTKKLDRNNFTKYCAFSIAYRLQNVIYENEDFFEAFIPLSIKTFERVSMIFDLRCNESEFQNSFFDNMDIVLFLDILAEYLQYFSFLLFMFK